MAQPKPFVATIAVAFGPEAALDPQKFARIHRSTIVNLEKIKELHPMFRGDFTVILRDGQELTLGKAYRDRLKI